MKTSEILNMDYYKDNNKNIFQKALRKIKPFERYEDDIPFDMLEKYVSKVEYKYSIMINYITPVYIPGERNMYSATIRDTEESKCYDIAIFASSFYELYVKISIYYFSKIKNNSLVLKDWNKRNKV
ncbi:MAG: hypothetical protein J6T10_22520 [Methanobrevibacter sp.]|nr:hypothetical protein [Methanobrevibacter sp.]